MTLTEFLLARIAEDEALLAVPMSRRMIGRKVVEEPITRLPEYMVRDRARWAAECEAKRRIVNMAWDHFGEDDYAWGMEEAKRQILVEMATPYADHPDYRDEWRP